MIDGKHLLIADNETDFSRRVIELLRDPEGAQMLAASGRTLVEEKYAWGRTHSMELLKRSCRPEKVRL